MVHHFKVSHILLNIFIQEVNSFDLTINQIYHPSRTQTRSIHNLSVSYLFLQLGYLYINRILNFKEEINGHCLRFILRLSPTMAMVMVRRVRNKS